MDAVGKIRCAHFFDLDPHLLQLLVRQGEDELDDSISRARWERVVPIESRASSAFVDEAYQASTAHYVW
jgi:hypothetical protein